MELLLRVGAVKEENGQYEVTSVGKVSSMLYYSPFDVADLRRNFKYLFAQGLESNDLALAMALGNVDSIRGGFVSRAEKEEMDVFAAKVRKAFGEQIDSTIKGAYAYHCLLQGLPTGPFASMARGIQMDFDRLASVLNLLDSMAAKWNRGAFFRDLSLRVAYGVRPELVGLCRLPGIGKVRAERLFSAGFRSPKDLLKNPQVAKRVLNMKDDKVEEIFKHAQDS
jgi:helicase